MTYVMLIKYKNIRSIHYSNIAGLYLLYNVSSDANDRTNVTVRNHIFSYLRDHLYIFNYSTSLVTIVPSAHSATRIMYFFKFVSYSVYFVLQRYTDTRFVYVYIIFTRTEYNIFHQN